MSIQTSPQPGAFERHLIRCSQNPLFPEKRRQVIQVEINQAQRRDADDAVNFTNSFRDLVQRAIELKPEEDSQVILDLKQDLDQAYEQCCGLPGDTQDMKAALRKLIDVVMRAVWRGAESDPAAQTKLREEELARETHFELLEHALIADLLRPDSPIPSDELAATLLSETEAAVAAAISLFDPDQLTLICREAEKLVAALPESSTWRKFAMARYAQIERHLIALPGRPLGAC